MLEKENHARNETTDILYKLEEIRQKLINTNETNGNLRLVRAMREEIRQKGWQGICETYHPDINLDDPAAYPLFELYKYVYDTMEHKL